MNALQAELTSSKTYVMLNCSDTTADNVEKIQTLLSHAIACAEDNDTEAVESTLDAIDAVKVDGWDLTSSARAQL